LATVVSPVVFSFRLVPFCYTPLVLVGLTFHGLFFGQGTRISFLVGWASPKKDWINLIPPCPAHKCFVTYGFRPSATRYVPPPLPKLSQLPTSTPPLSPIARQLLSVGHYKSLHPPGYPSQHSLLGCSSFVLSRFLKFTGHKTPTCSATAPFRSAKTPPDVLFRVHFIGQEINFLAFIQGIFPPTLRS